MVLLFGLALIVEDFHFLQHLCAVLGHAPDQQAAAFVGIRPFDMARDLMEQLR